MERDIATVDFIINENCYEENITGDLIRSWEVRTSVFDLCQVVGMMPTAWHKLRMGMRQEAQRNGTPSGPV